MLKILFSVIKLVVITTVVLILGNKIEIGGKTVSDHVRTQMAQIDHSDPALITREWKDKILKKSEQILPEDQNQLKELLKKTSQSD